MPGLFGKAGHVDPLEGARRGDQTDLPAVLLGQLDEMCTSVDGG